MTQTAAEIFRDYETSGVPASGPHQPEKARIREWGAMMEDLRGGGANIAYASKAALLADLAHPAGSVAMVYSDATAANNGSYVKSGAAGSGTWGRFGDLPNEIVRLTVAGGTANAIVATAIETPTVPGSKLYLLAPTASNTAAVTIAVNGGSAVAITSAIGASLAANALLNGSQVLMAWLVDHYQLLVSAPVDASGILTDALAARDASQGYAVTSAAARDAAIAAAGAANTTGVATIAALRSVAPSGYAIATTKGYYAAGDGGGATFAAITGASAGTYVDNAGSIIVPTGGDGSATWLAQAPLLRALQWGLKGDGATDDSVKAQNFVDKNKGKRLTFDGGRSFLMAGVLLNDTSYNGTELVFDGTLLLKARASALDVNMQSNVFVGIGVQGADGVRVDGNFNGNRAAQYDIEQTFCLCLAGVTNFKSKFLSFKEVSGDGLYITTANIISSSANSDTLTFGTIVGENAADHGRNLVSLISGDNVTIGVLRSTRIGGIVGGNLMPGGFDAEADNTYQSIKNLVIGAANIVTAGSAGFQLFCQPISGSVKGVNVGALSVVNTGAATVHDEIGNLTITNNQLLLVRNCEDVSIPSFKGEHINAYGVGVVVGNGIKILIKGSVRHAAIGVQLAVDAGDIYALADSSIEIDTRVIARFGFQVGNVRASKVAGTVTEPQSGFYTSMFGVQAIGAWTQSEVVYSVQVVHSSSWSRAYRNDNSSPVTMTDCKIMNVNFTYDWPTYLSMVDMPVRVYNSPGYTDSILGAPSEGQHMLGQVIMNASPVVGQSKGYMTTVSGNPGTSVSIGNL
jgi:hypothetical protein